MMILIRSRLTAIRHRCTGQSTVHRALAPRLLVDEGASSKAWRWAPARRLLVGFLAAASTLLAFSAAPAMAEETAPQWTVSSVSRPTVFAVAGSGSYSILVTNSGGAAAGCTSKQWSKEIIEDVRNTVCPQASPVVAAPIVIVDELPAGLQALPGAQAEDEFGAALSKPGSFFGGDCGPTGSGGVTCSYGGVVAPGDSLILSLPVRVSALEAGSITNVVRVSGGGAVSAAARETPTRIAEDAAKARQETPFDLSPGGSTTALSSLQAGAHPDITTTGAFNTEDSVGATAGAVKDIVTDEPPGFTLDPLVVPTCASQLFLAEECPSPTQVGITTQIVDLGGSPIRELRPVYALAAEQGDVAKIGFNISGLRYVGDIAVRPAGERCQPGAMASCEYGGRVTFANVTGAVADYDQFSLTLWGVPAAAAHDPFRWEPSGGFRDVPSPTVEVPFFTNPTSCGTQPLDAEFHVTSWQHPGEAQSPPPTEMPFGPIVGCDRLGMEPSLTAEATSNAAYSPTGFDVDTKIPQTYEDPAGLATSTLRDEVVTLPEGMTVNPSSGAGLAACSAAQYAEEGAREPTVHEKSEGHGCPSSSKLATVKIRTPLLAEEVEGSVFLAQPAPNGEQGKNPFGSLLAVYLIARVPNRGVFVKSAGKIEANAVTGQLTTRFEGAPEFAGLPASEGLPPLPFTIARFEFNQGANAPLVTPPTCGAFRVTAQLTPWSNPEGAPLTPEIAPFPITANCPSGGVSPFAPQALAGTDNNAAGSYSPFYLRISRNDGEQEITDLSTLFPPGLTANLNGVPFCGEGEIAAARAQTGVQAEEHPACPAASQIGHSIAEAGVGSVLAQTPGRIYLSGPFEGAPFSVLAITSAHVGPFDLGTVVIHLPLDINPETAQVSIPAGPADQIPHIIKGIVIHLRTIRVYIDRERFMLNPTSCNPTTLTATIVGAGANFAIPADANPVTVNDPFQTADCSSLKFEPKFAVSTDGKTSRADGASLKVQLTYPSQALSKDANIHSVKVDLPKSLPSRLTTLQRACTAAEFDANPASCPPESIVGHAKAITPILPAPLEGPAYFVSHGGEAFPNLILVLQGYGVTIDLVGDTDIKDGITSSTFTNVPDQPVASFELNLPQGKYSALAANGNLCQQSLVMPTSFVAQNGATLNQNTHIEVEGCSDSLSVLSKGVKGHTITLHVAVPGAGALQASGKGLTKGSGSASGRETVTIKLHIKRKGEFTSKIKLSFKQSSGKSLTKTLKVQA
jgi:hypothetical protein